MNKSSRKPAHKDNLVSGSVALGWLHRKEDKCMPKAVFVELQERVPDHHASRKCYKDWLKRQLPQAGINHQSWQQEASNQDCWR